MAAYWLSLGRGGGVVHDGPDLKWAYTGQPVLNRVIGARLDPRDADARIADVVQRFDAWRASVTWVTGPADQPADLPRRLEAHGFAYQESWAGMALSLSPAVSASPWAGVAPGFVVREVADHGTLRAWLQIVCVAFRLPRAAADVLLRLPHGSGFSGTFWRRYVGFLDSRPVTTATVVSAAAAPGVAGVYLVGTVPDTRRRGLGTAITRYALAEARTEGARLAVLQATPGGRDLYRRLGFEEHCAVGLYRRPPPHRFGLLRRPRRWLGHLRRLWSGHDLAIGRADRGPAPAGVSQRSGESMARGGAERPPRGPILWVGTPRPTAIRADGSSAVATSQSRSIK
ncbi:MAG: GNAT family N-acetyltransferase [Chloroflexota bacterium]